MKKDYALVTGGSLGLGRSMAFVLAGRGYNIILVSYPDEFLETTALELESAYDIDVKIIGIDLSKKNACKKVFAEVKSWNVNLKILINNVGLGDVSHFEETTLTFNRRLVRLNCMVMVELSHLLLPLLKKNKLSYILNIGSLASLFPVPYKVVYSASKYFVKSFSFALREELRQDGISVTVVFPGSMLTNANVIRRVNSFGTLARACSYDPDFVAKVSLNAMFKRKRKAYPGFVNNLYIYLRHLIGYSLTMKMVKGGMLKEAIWDKEYKSQIIQKSNGQKVKKEPVID